MTALSGAREGANRGVRGLLARAMAHDLCAFVVPGLDVARARGLDLDAVGLHRADSPRHANVLLVAGRLPSALLDAACVVWAQMPRPRAILALGAGDIAPLSSPDAAADLSQMGLVAGLLDLRAAFTVGAFASPVAAFDAPALATRIEFTCPMHPEVISDQPGKCPKCGMFLVERAFSAGVHGTQAAKPAQDEIGDHEEHATHGRTAHTEPADASFVCPMHPEVTSDSPGSCPKCGMDLVSLDEAGAAGGHARQAEEADVLVDHNGHCGHDGHHDISQGDSHGQAEAAYACPMHPEVTSDSPGSCPKCGMDLVSLVEAGDHPAHFNHGMHGAHRGHDRDASHGNHGGHKGHGSAPDIPGIEPHFMSMVNLTRDMPASPDGLKMEWIEAPFGPFFPGLPGGLGLTLTLDGDSVAKSRAASLAPGELEPGFPAAELPRKLAGLTPLAPMAMRELGIRALEAVAGASVPPDRLAARAAIVERERIASHVNWLACIARQLGLFWLERRAAAVHVGLREAEADDLARRCVAIRALVSRVRATPLLRHKLAGIARIEGETAAGAGGPVARAAGYAADARAGEPAYAALGFAVVTGTGGDAWARLGQRLAEIEQSLEMVAHAEAIVEPEPQMKLPMGGHGMAKVETPRGPAALHLALEGGVVAEVQLTMPFSALAALLESMMEQMELGDALTAVGSLDLDPWGAGP